MRCLSLKEPWRLIDDVGADQFIFDMLALGSPIEVSLVGVFDYEGRGSRRDIELPLHRDGDYSIQHKGEIDFVGLYCLREGEATTLIEDSSGLHKIKLKKRQAIILDNKICRHGRNGKVGERLLLRIWIKENATKKKERLG